MSVQSDDKRIAKNTLFLYFRMILIMFVSLYTSRVVLAELGVEDYGIYNVVGGIVVMFSFLNSCLVTSTQRFLNYEMGSGNVERLRKTFSACLNIHVVIALLILVLAETIGFCFLNYKLNIPQERMWAANLVFQFSIFTFCTNVLQTPYNAAIIAHERMEIYSYVSILEAFLKLCIVYLLEILSYDKLITYAFLIFVIQAFIRFLYQQYCKRNFSECRFALFYEKALYYNLIRFAGWNFFGSIAWIFRGQGVDIVLNIFFGPAVNAARGIASQVSGAVMGFISNFQTAMNPQITKRYAANEISSMMSLVCNGMKYSFILLFVLAFPLMLNVDFVLGLWLKNIPAHTSIFVNLILTDSLVLTLFGNPLMTSLSATGKIRNYQVVVSLIIMLICPLSYIAFCNGAPIETVFYMMIILSFVSGVVRFMFCMKQIGFSARFFILRLWFPVICIVLLSVPIPLYIRMQCLSSVSWNNFIWLSLLTIVIILFCSWIFAFSQSERMKIKELSMNKFLARIKK